MGRSYTVVHAAVLIEFLPAESALVTALNKKKESDGAFGSMDAARMAKIDRALGVRR